MVRVIKVARQGYDVKTAGDENLLYSSEWPVLSIYKEIPVKITNPNEATVIADHDLGYPPMFWDFLNFTNTSILPGTSNFFSSLISVNDKQIKYRAPASPVTGTIEGMIQIFTLDLSKQYTAPVIDVGGVKGGGLSERVFKLAKVGKSITSPRLKDFVITTEARSPLIHSVTPGTVSGLEFKVEHKMGYVPLFFGYTKQDPDTGVNGSDYFLLATGGGGASQFSSSETEVKFSENANGRELTIVVLKDPFEAELAGVVAV